MTNKHNCCCRDGSDHLHVENMTLQDGRLAERHISFDENGNEIVEIFAEEPRAKKLEKRVVREYKNIVSKETHEEVRDGVVTSVEVRSLEPQIPLQIVERLGVADHAKVVNGDYIRRDEIGAIVSQGVIDGVTALMDNLEPLTVPKELHHQHHHEYSPMPENFAAQAPAPIFKAQGVVEKNVLEKNKNSMMTNIALAGILIVQAVFFGYMLLT